jgi:spore germination protein KB
MNVEDGKISARQLTLLLTCILISTAILILPALVIQEARQDAWLSVLVVTLLGIATGLLQVRLGLRFPGKTIIEYSKEIAGRPLGALLGLSYIALLFYISVLIIREFLELLKSEFFPETPMEIFAVVIVLAAAYIIRRGLEVLCRTNEILLPFELLFIIGGFFLIFKDLDFTRLLPVLSGGFLPVLKGAYPATVFFTETNLVAVILPALNIQRYAARSVVTAVVAVGLFHTVLCIAVLALLGLNAADRFFSVIDLFRYISVGDIIERQEALVMAIWTGTSLVKIGLYYYCTCLASARWAGLRDYRPLVFPIGLLLVLVSIINFPNIAVLQETILKIIPTALSIQIGLPLLLLIVAVFRGKGGSAGEKAG